MNCERDRWERTRFEIDTGQNTALDMAIQSRSDGTPSHFFSPDLRALARKGEYSNERQHFEHFYQSALVVPIRGVDKRKEGTNEELKKMFGYLSVDSLSRNRLSNGYPLYILCSQAFRMYTFTTVVRENYT